MTMSFISYAQNYEDVMLMRAFRDISNGFYIDVGAERPEDDSVTKAFYERGWSGINIEPARQYYNMLALERPRDLNLQCFVGASIGTREFFEVADTGLSTGLRSLADNYTNHRVARYEVQELTLDEICRVHNVTNVHFLKIDAEGAEREVLAGFSLEHVRPWILVVESRAPNSTEPNYSEWEPRVLCGGYEFVWDDGINRFYVAAEHMALAGHFKLPPNVFDDFERLNFTRMRSHVDFLVHQIELFREREAAASKRDREREKMLVDCQRTISQLQSKMTQQSLELTSVYGSTSWRITRPIRICGSLVHKSSKFRRIANRGKCGKAVKPTHSEKLPEQDEELSEYAQWIYDRLK
jgi:FkbM family methyltransferase